MSASNADTSQAASTPNNSTLEHVWKPLTLNGITFKNRILQPAHSSQHGDPRDHVFSDRQIAYFRERAKGGVALSVTETVLLPRGVRWVHFFMSLMCTTKRVFLRW